MLNRIFLIVLDSFGIGALPDAANYGDGGANTLASLLRSDKLSVENLKSLGLFNIDGVGGGVDLPRGAYARMTEKSNGKDTIIGHWEMCGVVSERDMPTYPNGFPKEIIDEFERRCGRGTLCNLPYSGTKVIADYGKEHVETGKLIVYTSADSVFQIAAHEDVVPIDELYRCCEIAREILIGEHGVGRVIARPFEGEHPYTRTSRRHDYAILPPHETTLDLIKNAGLDTVCVGKISDIFASQGVTKSIKTSGNTDGMAKALEVQESDFGGFAFINLVDFDSVYGHRRDIDGYAAALSEFDAWLPKFIAGMREGDVLMITGDHGCDPGFGGTDHTREYTPLLVCGEQIKPTNLGVRNSFADIGASVCEMLGVKNTLTGTSFANEVIK
ncbi:MAG: phosphopentomutase [Clostridia bacterium]|nr:phosphopentomutase [Clostridia bacterium]